MSVSFRESPACRMNQPTAAPCGGTQPMRPLRWARRLPPGPAWWLACLLVPSVARSEPGFAWRVAAEGTVLESRHPRRPGDSREYSTILRLTLDEQTGEGQIELVDARDTTASAATFHWRHGRLFQANADDEDLPAEGFLDLSPATIAMLHPRLVTTCLRERPESSTAAWASGPASEQRLSWLAVGDVLWRIEEAPRSTAAPAAIRSVTRVLHDEIRGMTFERIGFTGHSVTVTHADSADGPPARTVASFSFQPQETIARHRTPKGDPRRDTTMVIPPEDFQFRELGGGLFACELERANARVFVVEFEKELLVFEGIFSSRNAETMAAAVRERFGKPVSHFAFSHIHPQYLAGIRTWAGHGATILTPRTSVPSVTDVLSARFDLRPDAWSTNGAQPRIAIVERRWSREDESASVVILNDPRSDHTDEYLLAYLPRTKTLLTGDLLFHRPGQPLRGRSLTLARYVREVGLDVERCITTWPLEWPGSNELSGEELRAAAEAGESDPAENR